MQTLGLRVRKKNREPKRTVKLAKVRMNVCVVSKGRGLRRGRFSVVEGSRLNVKPIGCILKQNTNTFSISYFCSKSLQLWYV